MAGSMHVGCGECTCRFHVRDSDRSVDDGSPSGFKAFVVCRHDYGSSPVIFFLAMVVVELGRIYLKQAF
jgi:hypothetical protein